MNKILFAIMSVFPALAHAHSDHGVGMLENLWHVFTNPEHIWPLTAGIVSAIVVLARQRQ